jgi:hypothetical protein
MKKLFIVLFILSLSWLVKLSYDLHVLNTAQTEFNQSINQLQQQNANLNDQFVALKRQISAQQESAGATSAKASVNEAATDAPQNDIVLVQQHLDLHVHRSLPDSNLRARPSGHLSWNAQPDLHDHPVKRLLILLQTVLFHQF